MKFKIPNGLLRIKEIEQNFKVKKTKETFHSQGMWNKSFLTEIKHTQVTKVFHKFEIGKVQYNQQTLYIGYKDLC